MKELQTVILRTDCPGTIEHVRHFKRNIVNIFHVGRNGAVTTQKGINFYPIEERKEYNTRYRTVEDHEETVIEWELDMKNPIDCEPY
jgi:hypothetical protein